MMKEIIYVNSLYDYYGDLLTEKQQSYFEDYYFNNLSLAEIGSNNNVSRNAIHKQVKDIEKKLFYFEEKLKLFEKGNKIKEIINNLKPEIKEEIIKLI